jgi:hypothetical protein
MVTAGKVMAMTFADLVASNAALSGEVRRSHEALKIAQLTIDKMKVELAYLRRMKYGRSSEKLEHATSRAPSTWCATCARSWPARGATRSRRRWRQVGRLIGAWLAPDCSRTSR